MRPDLVLRPGQYRVAVVVDPDYHIRVFAPEGVTAEDVLDELYGVIDYYERLVGDIRRRRARSAPPPHPNPPWDPANPPPEDERMELLRAKMAADALRRRTLTVTRSKRRRTG